MLPIRRIVAPLLFSHLLLATSSVSAGLQMTGTRVIFLGDKKEASIPAENTSKRPVLMQAWIDHNEEVTQGLAHQTSTADTNTSSTNPSTQASATEPAPIPFFVTPPLSRLEGGKRNVLRILRIGQGLPDDRESIFWLNIKEIPEAVKGENILQLAIHTRLKLFFRPSNLPSTSSEAYRQLRWYVVTPNKKLALRAVNPTPYYITLSRLKTNHQEDVAVAGMVPPFGEITYPLEQTTYAATDITQITYQTINDYGTETEAIQTKPTL